MIADDHPIVRAATWRVLEAQPDFEPVAEAAELDAAVGKVLGYKLTALVTELNLRDSPTVEAIPRIFAASPHTAIVILTADDAPASARAQLRAGASGFVPKQAPEAELIDAARAAAARGELASSTSSSTQRNHSLRSELARLGPRKRAIRISTHAARQNRGP